MNKLQKRAAECFQRNSELIAERDAALERVKELKRLAENWEANSDQWRAEWHALKRERDELAADSRDLQLRQTELLTELAEANERADLLAASSQKD